MTPLDPFVVEMVEHTYLNVLQIVLKLEYGMKVDVLFIIVHNFTTLYVLALEEPI